MSVTISAALKSHFALPSQTVRSLLKFTQKDTTVIGFTDHDRAITIGGVTYNPGFDRSDASGAADLSVDNFQQQGVLNSPMITEEDLRIGKWDYARYIISLCNWSDLTMGVCAVSAGWLGEVSTERVTYSAELNSLTKAYARTIGELTGATCRADLYDARCGVSPTGGSPSFTVTGTLTGASDDLITLYDDLRTEPGPSGAVPITNISKHNPGVVTLGGSPLTTFIEGDLVIISGVLGMTEVNTQTRVHSPSEGQFELSVDTSSFTAYAGGGIVTLLGAESGWFDYGVITFTGGASGGGLNTGFSMEVARYTPGQIQLALPMPYPCQAGDTYTMTAGCDKFLTTCHSKFDNVVNYRGEWYLTGNDKLISIGKQQ